MSKKDVDADDGEDHSYYFTRVDLSPNRGIVFPTIQTVPTYDSVDVDSTNAGLTDAAKMLMARYRDSIRLEWTSLDFVLKTRVSMTYRLMCFAVADSGYTLGSDPWHMRQIDGFTRVQSNFDFLAAFPGFSATDEDGPFGNVVTRSNPAQIPTSYFRPDQMIFWKPVNKDMLYYDSGPVTVRIYNRQLQERRVKAFCRPTGRIKYPNVKEPIGDGETHPSPQDGWPRENPKRYVPMWVYMQYIPGMDPSVTGDPTQAAKLWEFPNDPNVATLMDGNVDANVIEISQFYGKVGWSEMPI